MINIKLDKKKLAIVVVGYNRLNSMQRLMSSLLNAIYDIREVPLIVSIDCSWDFSLYDYVQNFQWPYGPYYVNIQKERLGLKNHIFQCAALSEYFQGVIILEDDLFVAPDFYNYSCQAVNAYYNEDKVAGIALYREETFSPYRQPRIFYQDGSDSLAYKWVETWGECITDKMWKSFKHWYDAHTPELIQNADMPNFIKKWERAWSKYYFTYMVQTDRYFVYPSVSLTTCFSETGEHGDAPSCVGQVNLFMGKKQYDFRPFSSLVKYDIYGANEDVSKWLDLDANELSVDFYGINSNIRGCMYCLSTFEMPYEIIDSFALKFRPIELNIKYKVAGKDIFLYDLSKPTKTKINKKYPVSLAFYNIREYAFNHLLSYCIYNICIKIKIKLRTFF